MKTGSLRRPSTLESSSALARSDSLITSEIPSPVPPAGDDIFDQAGASIFDQSNNALLEQ